MWTEVDNVSKNFIFCGHLWWIASFCRLHAVQGDTQLGLLPGAVWSRCWFDSSGSGIHLSPETGGDKRIQPSSVTMERPTHWGVTCTVWGNAFLWCNTGLHGRLKKGKGSPYSITEHRVPELIPVLSSQPAGEVTWFINLTVGCYYFPSGLQLPPQPLKRAVTNFAAWWT